MERDFEIVSGGTAPPPVPVVGLLRRILTLKQVSAYTPPAQRTERRIQGYSEIVEQLSWLNAIDYHTHRLNWVECIETITDQKTGAQSRTRFVHLSDIPVDGTWAHLISQTGQLRWKIENEGFNTQKNHGYGLQHKFSRRSWQAAKNYYQCLQMAYLINQLWCSARPFNNTSQVK
jgi:hypothetical protein